jgi:GNAT superfamily N-acetyltransferase
MASTKQMQARAKTLKVAKKAQVIGSALMDRLDAIADVCDMVPAGPKLVGNMYNDFHEDYVKMGDVGSIKHSFSDYLDSGRRAFVIMYNKRIAGFITLAQTLTNKTYVELVYVKPEFRGKDLSSLMYMWARQEQDAEAVELSYQRISGKEHYWTALGFNRFCPIPGQMGTKIALGLVSSNPKIGWDLTPQNLREIRSYVNTHDIRKTGTTVSI